VSGSVVMSFFANHDEMNLPYFGTDLVVTNEFIVGVLIEESYS